MKDFRSSHHRVTLVIKLHPKVVRGNYRQRNRGHQSPVLKRVPRARGLLTISCSLLGGARTTLLAR